MDNSSYELILQNSIADLDSISLKSRNEMETWGYVDADAIEKSESSLDAWDYCFSIAIGLAGATISTNEQLENYLKDIHDAASGASGDYDALQKALGSILHHQGDAMDKYYESRPFINREYENANGLFHRLLWGHDILSLSADNPFKIMVEQKGIFGIIQVVRHLLADTMSKQGLPLPGSSFLDYRNENGKITNYLISISQNISNQAYGTKLVSRAQQVYSHMFTLRAQDIMAGGAIAGLDAIYFKVRKIEDDVRKVQFRLISYAIAFFGEAIIGSIKHKGVLYVNLPMATVMFKNLVQLYYFSIKQTRQLHDKTFDLIAQGAALPNMVNKTGDGLQSYDAADEYLTEIQAEQDNVDSLIAVFEGSEL